MKRLGSSDSLGALISVYTTDGQSPRSSQIYNREFQSMLGVLDEEGYIEENVHEKKRRLSVDQVKALEKNFEIENKLEPERKVKLAQDLGLQPRQVAVWFQNRRARWKTKQLERDYGVLKANYESLKLNYESLQKENDALSREIKELRSKLHEEDGSKDPEPQDLEGLAPTNMKLEDFKNGDTSSKEEFTVFPNLKDGSSESDSSVILQEENSSNIANSSLKFSASSSSPVSSMGFFPFSQKGYQPQFVKMEEHNFLGPDEACNFFSDEQPPSMPWFGSDQWG